MYPLPAGIRSRLIPGVNRLAMHVPEARDAACRGMRVPEEIISCLLTHLRREERVSGPQLC